MKHVPVPQFVMDFGWSAAVLIALLQIATAYLPVGEPRDWSYYFLVGGWAAFVILSGFASRFILLHKNHRVLEYSKIALSIYAAAALSHYFIVSLLSWWFVWIWVLALLVTWQWLKTLAIREPLTRLVWGAGMVWFIVSTFAVCGTLIYRSPWFDIITQKNAIQYALGMVVLLLFTCPFIYSALISNPSSRQVVVKPAWLIIAHVVVLYLLVLIQFRVDGLDGPTPIHHWKAYLEPAASVRAGGWLLWDVPSQYGFLVTLVIAALPVATVWQSLYLLNGTLGVLSGLVIFSTLFKKYPSLAGFCACLMVTIASVALLLPTTPDPRMFPSTGPLRFFWVYLMAGYVFHVRQHYYKAGTLPRFTYGCGNLLWLVGALWSLESAIYMTIMWGPSLMLMAIAERFAVAVTPSFCSIAKHVAYRLASLAVVALFAFVAIIAFYYVMLGYSPDPEVLTAYIKGFATNVTTVPITMLGTIPCWLCIFFMMVMVCRSHVAKATINAPAILDAAVFYVAISALWAIASYYIPYSEDFHLTGMLPVMVYLSAILLLLMQTLEIPVIIRTAYEKCLICFYSVIVLATVSHFGPGITSDQAWLSPVSSDITKVLPVPPVLLQHLVVQAKLPEHAHVLIISDPFTHVGVNSYLIRPEGYYFRDMSLQPWLLPNTLVGYEVPLSPALYTELAQRRAERMDNSDGWIIEKKNNPLEQYPWIVTGIARFYRQAGTWENDEFRIRHYQKISSK